MTKKFLCRVKVQKEEHCQFQELSENALRGGQEPVQGLESPGLTLAIELEA